MKTDRALFQAVRAMPHMTITKADGEYRVTYLLDSIRQADRGRHGHKWHVAHAEKVSYYTTDREDAQSSAQSLSDHMTGIIARAAQAEAGQ